MRVLGRVRLSRAYDESTSVERQRELIQKWADENDHTVVGWAEDLDVSGAVDPFQTPQLGEWLNHREHDWDILVAWKLDRIARRAVPLHRIFGYCEEKDKTLVCITDNIDLSNWVGRLVASVIAGVAEGELEAIRERTKASHRKLRELGRWPGGRPAYGFQAIENPDGPGWSLVHDETAAPNVRMMIERTLAGDTLEMIADELTRNNVPTPADHVRIRAGRESKGAKWNPQSVSLILRSKTMLGHVTHQGNTVLDAKGEPILKGPPICSLEEFYKVQEILDARSRGKGRTRVVDASPLLGIALCLDCEEPLHQRTQRVGEREYRYYNCRNKHGQQIKAEHAELLVEERLLDEIGDVEVLEKVVHKPQNHQIEIEAASKLIDELTPLLGTVTSDTMRKRLTEQISALDFKIASLEKLNTQPVEVEWRPTGETYRDTWGKLDTRGRRELMLRSGVVAKMKQMNRTRSGAAGEFHFEMFFPPDITTRVRHTQKTPSR